MKGAPWSISELLGLWLVTSKDQGADPPSSRESPSKCDVYDTVPA